MFKVPVKPVHPLKAALPIAVTPEGKFKAPVKPVHPPKAALPIFVNPEGRFKVPVNPLHPEKRPSSISVISEGSTKLVNPMQFRKGLIPNVIPEFGIFNAPVKPLQY